MRRRITGLAILLIVVPVACSVVDEGKVEHIDPPFGLDDTLPSSTSSTSTTVLETTTTGAIPPTTLPTESVTLYFVTNGQLAPLLQPLPTPVTLQTIIAALQLGPAGDGLRTVVPSEVDIRVTTDGSGVATINLPPDFFELVPLPSQRLVIAQLVLTITSSRGIGQVVFNQRVPLPGGTEQPAGLQLTFSDYEVYTGTSPQFSPDPTLPAATTSTTDG